MAFKIAVVQFEPVRRNVPANIKQIQSLLDGFRADLVVLPELANSGYLYKNTEDLYHFSEEQTGKGPYLSAISKIASDIGGLIVTGYSEKKGDFLFNSAAAISAEGVVANYRKVHLYNTEKSLFMQGDEGFTSFEWKGVNIGLMICFDWIFPESARTLALKGAQIIAHPANLVLPFCQNAMVTRSIENQIFTITANRIGSEKLNNQKLSFTGSSQITNPKGEVLFRGPKNKATVHTLFIDPAEAHNKQISQQNDLFADRKTQFYEL